MTTPPAPYIEALERALGRVIQDAQRQVELQAARANEVIADLRLRNAEITGRLVDLERGLNDRVAAGIADGIQAILDASSEAESARAMEVRGFAERLDAVEQRPDLEERLAAVEARAPEVTADDFAALRLEVGELREAIPEVPEPKDWSQEIESVRAAIPSLPEPPDLSSFATREELGAILESIPDWSREIEAVRGEIPAPVDPPDLSGFATKAELEALRGEIPDPPEPRDWAPEIEAVRQAIPVVPDPPDLSGFATKADIAAVKEAIPEIPDIPEPKDWAPDIERIAAEARGIASELKERLDRHPGRFPLCRAWSDSVHYSGELVRHHGALWQAVRDTGREPPHEDWACIVERGTDGRSFRVRGAYSEDDEYRELDVVVVNYSGFVAVQDNPGPCPGDGWRLLAGRGKPGRPGDKGDSIKGDPGKPGEPVIGAEVTDDGELILTNGDGSQVKADFYPLLEKVQRS